MQIITIPKKAVVKAVIYVLLSFLMFSFVVLPSWSDERIHKFTSEIEVNPDGSMEVTESIYVRAEGYQIKRGIYRDFPTLYRGKNGHRYTVGFDVVSVNRDGHVEPYHIKNMNNGKRIYIGRENVFLEDRNYLYEITYRTTRQLGFF